MNRDGQQQSQKLLLDGQIRVRDMVLETVRTEKLIKGVNV